MLQEVMVVGVETGLETHMLSRGREAILHHYGPLCLVIVLPQVHLDGLVGVHRHDRWLAVAVKLHESKLHVVNVHLPPTGVHAWTEAPQSIAD